MENSELLEHLKNLEIELHQPKCRSNKSRLSELLHESFVEFGQSGKSYSKKSIIEALSEEDGALNVWSQNYSLHFAKGGSAIVLYQAAHQNPDGSLDHYSNRSSHWVFDQGRWQLCFHQGTPTNAFSKSSI